jgi:hypothetical protein
MSTMHPRTHGRIGNLILVLLHSFAIACCMQNQIKNPLDKPLAAIASFRTVDNLGITWG